MASMRHGIAETVDEGVLEALQARSSGSAGEAIRVEAGSHSTADGAETLPALQSTVSGTSSAEPPLPPNSKRVKPRSPTRARRVPRRKSSPEFEPPASKPDQSKAEADARTGSSTPREGLPKLIRGLPSTLRYHPQTFRAHVRGMPEGERAKLRREILAELRSLPRSRLSTDARTTAERQARFLLAVLDGRTAPTPPSIKKPPEDDGAASRKKQKSKSKKKRGGRLLLAQQISPSPPKYIYPTYGAPVSGGLPGLGRRA